MALLVPVSVIPSWSISWRVRSTHHSNDRTTAQTEQGSEAKRVRKGTKAPAMAPGGVSGRAHTLCRPTDICRRLIIQVPRRLKRPRIVSSPSGKGSRGPAPGVCKTCVSELRARAFVRVWLPWAAPRRSPSAEWHRASTAVGWSGGWKRASTGRRC